MASAPSIIRVVDLETTGETPAAHGVCEVGWQDVALGADGRWDLYGEGGSRMVNPGRPIPPVTQAIHHILDEQVADAPLWIDVGRPVLDLTSGLRAVRARGLEAMSRTRDASPLDRDGFRHPVVITMAAGNAVILLLSLAQYLS